jgi:acyl-CoA dehydrogenase
MSDLDLLSEAVGRLLADARRERAAEALAPGEWDEAAWQRMEAAGLARAGLDERWGGAGGGTAEALLVAGLVAGAGAALPYADSTALAAWVLGRAGLVAPPGVLAVAEPAEDEAAEAEALGGPEGPLLSRSGDRWWLDGAVRAVRWAPVADHLVVLAHEAGDPVPGAAGHDRGDRGGCGGPVAVVVALGADGPLVAPGTDLAGDPTGDVRFDASPVDPDAVARVGAGLVRAWRRRGALVRSAQAVGALEAMVPLVVEHATQREQFGRPIARFQAIQQHLAVLAGEAAVARAALDLAVEGERADADAGPEADAGPDADDDLAELAVAAAKVRVGQAATTGSRLAHQVVGAIGFTDEHPLCQLTRRLWCWRDEYGDEEAWARQLGRAVAGAGGDALWPTLTSLPATGSAPPGVAR